MDFPQEKRINRSATTCLWTKRYRRFSVATWRRSCSGTRRASVRDLDYGPASGSFALREAVCAHLRRSRAVFCDPSQIIVVNGSQQGLDLIARVLIERGDAVAIEDPDPQYQGTREVLRAAGARTLAKYRWIAMA